MDRESRAETAGRWAARVRSIGMFTVGDKRAPYKPLLLLWVIARHAARSPTRISFSEAEEPLQQLLDRHRFKESRPKPHNPFVYLGSDSRLWRVETASGLDVTEMDQTRKESVSFLRSHRVTGYLAPGFARALEDPQVPSQVINELLDIGFPESLHQEVLEEVGLDSLVAAVPVRRDPQFKRTVLLAYENRCAFCGFDGSLRSSPVAIDAAHVKMRSHRGPDNITNGIGLCVLHHRLFDRGAIGLNGDLRILVSQHMIVRKRRAQIPLIDLVGLPMRRPQPGYDPPDIRYVGWHYENIFVEPPRALVGQPVRHPSSSSRIGQDADRR